MSYTFIPLRISGAAGLIFGPLTTTGFATAPNTVSGLALGTNAVRGDALDVIGSTSNDRTYAVLDVVDANTVEVWPAIVAEAPLGTVELREQNHFLAIIDEATVNAETIAAAMAPLDSRIFERKFTIPAQTAGREFRIYGFLIRRFSFNNTAATTTDFLSEFEVWFLDWDGERRSSSTISSDWAITSNSVGAVGALTNIDFGSLADPTDVRSVQRGSVLLGGNLLVFAQGELATSVYGSFLHSGLSSLLYILADGPGVGGISGSVVNAGLVAPPVGSTLNFLQTVIQNAPNFGLAPLGEITTAANFLQADSANFGVIFSATEVIVRELELSDAAFTPAQFVFNSALTFVDPREDYTPAELFNNNNAASAKAYTFNPRFVDINFVSGPAPTVGAEVSITRVADSHYLGFLSATDGTYIVSINAEEYTHVSSGQTPGQLRNSIRDAINAGTQPVTAFNGNNSAPFGMIVLAINANAVDTPFALQVVSQPASSLVVDPAPNQSVGAIQSHDYREIPVVGSPFTIDANGRIDTNGVELAAFIGYEGGVGLRFFNLQYNITVEGEGFRREITGFKPVAPFNADFPVEDKRMGGFKQ